MCCTNPQTCCTAAAGRQRHLSRPALPRWQGRRVPGHSSQGFCGCVSACCWPPPPCLVLTPLCAELGMLFLAFIWGDLLLNQCSNKLCAPTHESCRKSSCSAHNRGSSFGPYNPSRYPRSLLGSAGCLGAPRVSRRLQGRCEDGTQLVPSPASSRASPSLPSPRSPAWASLFGSPCWPPQQGHNDTGYHFFQDSLILI